MKAFAIGKSKSIEQNVALMGRMMKAVSAIQYSLDINPDEKVRQRDMLYFGMIAIAEETNKLIDAMRDKEALGQLKKPAQYPAGPIQWGIK